MKLAFISLLSILVGSVFFHYQFFGLSPEFYENTLVNIVATTLILIPTVFIVEQLINKHQKELELKIEKENKKKEKDSIKRKYLETLNTRHTLLVDGIEKSFIHFITKKPTNLDIELNETINILGGLDSYVKDDFFKKKYELLVLNPKNIFKAKTEYLSYQKFCKHHFKDSIEKLIKDYTGRYVVFIPSEILESLFKIEDNLKLNCFVVPEDHGLVFDISQAQVDPTVVTELIKSLQIIGEEIVKLKKYNE